MAMVKQIRAFFSYWYLRYLVATELYMVEPWEKNFIHGMFVIILALLWYFNCTIVNIVSHLRGYLPNTPSLLEYIC